MDSNNKPGLQLSTRCSHSGTKPSQWAFSPIMPPIYLSTTFEVRDLDNIVYDYSRSGNPTRTELEKLFAHLESARYGLAFSSGLGAMTTLSYLLETGQQILCGDDVYGGTYRLFSQCVSRMGIDTVYVDGCNLSSWKQNFKQGKTKMIWIETPTNPTMKIVDIEAVAKEIKQMDKECIVVVDNTFMTAVHQNPLQLGADIVVHSCSKYIGGHSDLIMGALMMNDENLYQRLKFLQNALGIVPAPFDCSQMIRSIKTMDVRVREQTRNAGQIAAYLEGHPKIEKVIYPGLKSHPQHELAKKQTRGFGAMLSIYLRPKADGGKDGGEAATLMNSVELFHPAESLGCVSSLLEVPALTTHKVIPEDTKKKLGITNYLVRISVGIEHVDDLIADLDQALEKVYRSM